MAIKKQIVLRRRVKKIIGQRTVRIDFYSNFHATILIKVNRAKYAINACLNAFHHLRTNHYSEAVLAEVYDETTGKLYAVIKKDHVGNLHALFEDKVAIERDTADKKAKEEK